MNNLKEYIRSGLANSNINLNNKDLSSIVDYIKSLGKVEQHQVDDFLERCIAYAKRQAD